MSSATHASRPPIRTPHDRLGRSLKELLETVEDLKSRGIHLASLEERIDTSSAAGELVFHHGHGDMSVLSLLNRESGISMVIGTTRCMRSTRTEMPEMLKR